METGGNERRAHPSQERVKEGVDQGGEMRRGHSVKGKKNVRSSRKGLPSATERKGWARRRSFLTERKVPLALHTGGEKKNRKKADRTTREKGKTGAVTENVLFKVVP